MGKSIESKIADILNAPTLDEAVEWETIGGPTPSEVLKGPLDYAKNVKQAQVPTAPGSSMGAHEIPGVGEIGDDEADENDPITDVVDDMDEDEDHDDHDDDHDDDDDDDDDDEDHDDKDKNDKIEETFASLLARLAEEDLDEDEEGGETSLDDSQADFGDPEETLPDVDSKLDDPASLVTYAPGAPVAEAEDGDFGDPEETLPDVDSKLEHPDELETAAPGAKTPNVAEDIAAIFASTGVKLSEAGKAKAATIFQAAVSRRVNEEKQRVQKIATKKLKEAYGVLKTRFESKQNVYETKINTQVDQYLGYVVENWMKENQLAVERGIRAELAESFISGLKNLFTEHYIEVPETKVDVVATLGKKVTRLESKLNEQTALNVQMRASLSAYRKEEVIRATGSGLTDIQREKLRKLAEGVEYSTRKEFASKLQSLKESYFPKKATPPTKESLVEETTTATNPSSEMQTYVKTMSKMARS